MNQIISNPILSYKDFTLNELSHMHLSVSGDFVRQPKKKEKGVWRPMSFDELVAVERRLRGKIAKKIGDASFGLPRAAHTATEHTP